MIRIRGKIPITIHPAFWIFAALIGFLSSMSLIGTLVWVGIIFVSVLFHELGHALTAVVFGQKPRIELIALGGLTFHNGEKLPFLKQFLIVLNGPLFGFLLFIFATFLVKVPILNQGFVGAVLENFRLANLFWSILNLLPIMPLDGGQLLRIVLEAIFGVRGFKYTLMASMIIAALLSFVFFAYQAFLIGAILFLFAFQSYDAWRRMRGLTEKDRSDTLKNTLEEAENKLQSGKKEEAAAQFEKIRADVKEGMIYNLATQYLAYLKYDQSKIKEAYDLLLPLRSKLPLDALCLLHRAAFDQKDYSLVIELSGVCFQTHPSAETALRNAYACAELSQVRPTIGWLETALKEGLQNLHEILQEKCFDQIRKDPSFQEFLQEHKTA